MLKLITICLGTAFLMYLSGVYYPTDAIDDTVRACGRNRGCV